MAHDLHDSPDLQAPKHLDRRYGPYLSPEEANLKVKKYRRKEGLTVGVTQTDNTIIEYWWEEGVEDIHLVPKPGSYPRKEAIRIPTIRVGNVPAQRIPTKKAQRVGTIKVDTALAQRIPTKKAIRIPTVRVGQTPAQRIPTKKAQRIPTIKVVSATAHRIPTKKAQRVPTIKVGNVNAKRIPTKAAIRVPTIKVGSVNANRVPTKKADRIPTIKVGNVPAQRVPTIKAKRVATEKITFEQGTLIDANQIIAATEQAHDRLHNLDNSLDHAPDPIQAGKILGTDNPDGNPILFELDTATPTPGKQILIDKDYVAKKYTISLDETKINHNNLMLYAEDRHRKMNYSPDIKTYLIEN